MRAENQVNPVYMRALTVNKVKYLSKLNILSLSLMNKMLIIKENIKLNQKISFIMITFNFLNQSANYLLVIADLNTRFWDDL